jgi:hypothetical protein
MAKRTYRGSREGSKITYRKKTSKRGSKKVSPKGSKRTYRKKTSKRGSKVGKKSYRKKTSKRGSKGAKAGKNMMSLEEAESLIKNMTLDNLKEGY